MNTWATTEVKRGGSYLLPEGVGNYRITGHNVDLNQFNGTTELTIELSSNSGRTGKAIISLTASDDKYESVIASIFKGAATALGYEPPAEVAAQDITASMDHFIKTHLPTLEGAVVECNVVHKTYTKNDGSEGKRQSVYFNKIVQPAPVSAPASAVTAEPPAFI